MRLLKRTARSWYSGFMAFILVGLLIVPAGAVYALSPRERSENAPGEATDEVGGGLREAIGQNSVREDLRFVSGTTTFQLSLPFILPWAPHPASILVFR